MEISMMSPVEAVYSVGFGVVLGLSIAAPPGPVNATMARDTVMKSRLSGMLVGCGAMTADALFLILVLALGSLLILTRAQQGVIFLLGSSILFLISCFTMKALRERDDVLRAERVAPERMSYIAGLAIGMTNPYQIFWWLTVGLSFVRIFGLLLILGFFLGIALWITLFPSLLDLGMRRFSRVYAVVMIFSITCLLAFALWFLLQGVVLLLG